MKPLQIGLAITHYNRFPLLRNCFVQVLEDPRIVEVVISDDASNDGSWSWICEQYGHHPKIRLHRNVKNLDCHFNKQVAMRQSTAKWVVLFDSDNIIGLDYLDALEKLDLQPDTAYCPSFAKPHFDYRGFEGIVVDRTNVAGLAKSTTFLTALNTCNYLVHRESYLAVWDGSINPHTADSIYQNCRWLESGRKLVLVAGLSYFHRVHEQSHYKQNVHRTGDFAKQVERRLKEMK